MGNRRLCIIDTDGGFVKVLIKRASSTDWEHRILTSLPRLEELVAMKLNAIVVDIARIGPNGWEFLEKVCATIPDLGVIVCTGPSSVAQRVRGLRMGADDWVTKPCHPEEVMARVEAVSRRRKRAQIKQDVGPMVFGEIELRPDQYQAFVSGRSADLTKREFELVQLLAEANGQVLQREQIYERVWGYSMVRGDRSVDVFVRKLRKKLEKLSPNWHYIHTHFGIGYRLSAETAGGADSKSTEFAYKEDGDSLAEESESAELVVNDLS